MPPNTVPVNVIGSPILRVELLAQVNRSNVASLAVTVIEVVLGVQANVNSCGTYGKLVYCASKF